MVYIYGVDSEKIGAVHMSDLGLEKCSNCNQSEFNFNVIATIYVSKILAWQVAPKFGPSKNAWQIMIICPTCERGYKFQKEKGRDEVQNIMLKRNSLFANVWYHFLNEHALWNNLDPKDRRDRIKSGKKKVKTVLDDLARLGMNDLVHQIILGKEKFPKSLKNTMEDKKDIGFDIKL